MFLDPSWPPLQCVKCCIASKSNPDSISQSCTHLSNEQTCFPMFALVRAHTSHHCTCAVASVCSIFINSYFYSEPCRFQSVLSEPRLQPKYHREEQWEDRQLWKGAATLCATRVKHCNYSPGRPQSYLSLLVLWFPDPKALVFDWVNASVWQIRSSRNQESSYVFSSHYEDHFRW